MCIPGYFCNGSCFAYQQQQQQQQYQQQQRYQNQFQRDQYQQYQQPQNQNQQPQFPPNTTPYTFSDEEPDTLQHPSASWNNFTKHSTRVELHSHLLALVRTNNNGAVGVDDTARVGRYVDRMFESLAPVYFGILWDANSSGGPSRPTSASTANPSRPANTRTTSTSDPDQPPRFADSHWQERYEHLVACGHEPEFAELVLREQMVREGLDPNLYMNANFHGDGGSVFSDPRWEESYQRDIARGLPPLVAERNARRRMAGGLAPEINLRLGVNFNENS